MARAGLLPLPHNRPRHRARPPMRLVKVRVREFKSVLDSNECGVSDVTCLVGKNEAGNTAILQALYRLHHVCCSGAWPASSAARWAARAPAGVAVSTR